MKWLIYFWLLLTVIGATVMGWFDKPKPRVTWVHMTCTDDGCSMEGDLKLGQSIMAPTYVEPPLGYGSGERMQGKQREFTVREAVDERSEQ